MGRIRVLEDRADTIARLAEECRESVLSGNDDPLGLPLTAALEAANLLALAISRDVKEVGVWTLSVLPRLQDERWQAASRTQ